MKKTDPSILEAVDNLSSMVEVDEDIIELDKKEKGALHLRAHRWLDVKDEEKTLNSVKGTFRSVHSYLKHLHEKGGKQLNDKDVQRGVQSIMKLANEAAERIDTTTKLFRRKEKLVDSKEYLELVEFYEKKIMSRFEEILKDEEDWEEEWTREEDAADITRRGLKDLETVMKDRDYELFFLTNEEGSRFFNKNLSRHIRLVADFDMVLSNLNKEDPFTKIKILHDHRLQIRSVELKKYLSDDLDKWLKKSGKFRDDPFIQNVFKLVLALMMASNPENLLSKTMKKSSMPYYTDFMHHLRNVIGGVDYIQVMESIDKISEPFFKETINLLHKICFFLYTFTPFDEELYELFISVLEKSDKQSKKSTTSSVSIWNMILDDHDKLHEELQNFPNGPLFKVLDILHDFDMEQPFDPFMQEDLPSKAFQFTSQKKQISVLKSACPTTQKMINKALIIPEFTGFLRHIATLKKSVLVCNFQERTAWKEHIRSKVVEDYSQIAEVEKELYVLTVSKDTDFYHQTDIYLKMTDSKEFKEQLLEQIKGGEACGFSFPKIVSKAEIEKSAKEIISEIHNVFFEKKKTLSRKNRLDFIEIFYYCLIIYFYDLAKIDYIMMSGKDTIDLASIASGTFYALIKLLSTDVNWKEDEKEKLVSLYFLPAFLLREREVDIRHLNRSISMLSVISGEMEIDRKKVLIMFDKLFNNFTKNLKINKDL